MRPDEKDDKNATARLVWDGRALAVDATAQYRSFADGVQPTTRTYRLEAGGHPPTHAPSRSAQESGVSPHDVAPLLPPARILFPPIEHEYAVIEPAYFLGLVASVDQNKAPAN